MSLSSLAIPSETVSLGAAGSFTVYGLTADGIGYLVRKHEADLGEAYAAVRSGEMDAAAIASLVQRFSGLAATVIAVSAGEPEMAETAARLPLSVQVDAIEKIGALTFVGEDAAKKFIETVIRWMQAATTMAPAQRA